MPGAGQLGGRPRTGPGTSGWPPGWHRRGRRARRAARAGRPGGVRRALAQGRRALHRGDRRTTCVRYDTWLSWFEEQGVEAVGFGWINLRNAARQAGAPRDLLEWPYDVEQPIAPAIARLGGRPSGAEVGPDSRLRASARTCGRRRSAPPGAEDPETIVLRQQRGLRRARQADTVEAALVGACDGELTVGQILDAVAQLLDLDPAETRATYLPVVRELVAEGFLEA